MALVINLPGWEAILRIAGVNRLCRISVAFCAAALLASPRPAQAQNPAKPSGDGEPSVREETAPAIPSVRVRVQAVEGLLLSFEGGTQPALLRSGAIGAHDGRGARLFFDLQAEPARGASGRVPSRVEGVRAIRFAKKQPGVSRLVVELEPGLSRDDARVRYASGRLRLRLLSPAARALLASTPAVAPTRSASSAAKPAQARAPAPAVAARTSGAGRQRSLPPATQPTPSRPSAPAVGAKLAQNRGPAAKRTPSRSSAASTRSSGPAAGAKLAGNPAPAAKRPSSTSAAAKLAQNRGPAAKRRSGPAAGAKLARDRGLAAKRTPSRALAPSAAPTRPSGPTAGVKLAQKRASSPAGAVSSRARATPGVGRAPASVGHARVGAGSGRDGSWRETPPIPQLRGLPGVGRSALVPRSPSRSALAARAPRRARRAAPRAAIRSPVTKTAARPAPPAQRSLTRRVDRERELGDGQGQLAGHTIVLDPGGGGAEVGAVGGGGLREKDLNLAVARRLGRLLEARGARVVYTRTKDAGLSLQRRTQIANHSKAELFVSIHASADPDRSLEGIQTYYLDAGSRRYARSLARQEQRRAADAGDPQLRLILADLTTRSTSAASRRLAGHVQRELVRSVRPSYQQLRDLGAKKAVLSVLLGVQMPSVLVRTGYISHPQEAARLRTGTYQEQLAQGIAEGLEAFAAERRRVARDARRSDPSAARP